MKGLFKIISVAILLAALAGGILLVKRNQETRRGAAASETSSQILPDRQVVKPNGLFGVTVWFNTGKPTDMLAGADFKLAYDATKVKFMKIEPASDFQLVGNVIDDGKALWIRMVTIGEEKGGAVQVAKVNFQMLGGDSGSLVVEQGKLAISNAGAVWDIGKNNPGNFSVNGGTTITPRVTAWQRPTLVVSTPVKQGCIPRPSCLDGVVGTNGVKTYCDPKPLAPGEMYCPKAIATVALTGCGQRCYSNGDCTAGMICTPIWWPCTNLSATLGAKLQKNESLDKATVVGIVSVCPDVEKTLPTNYKSSTEVKLPQFYGVCRSQNCPQLSGCDCKLAPTKFLVPTAVESVDTRIDR